jgi:hypothetical protein
VTLKISTATAVNENPSTGGTTVGTSTKLTDANTGDVFFGFFDSGIFKQILL